ncbi:kinase-like protein [Gonapodya prolifera JEL478]|uniref:Kinase-like protein n=1 Tax=Gonapodya prolifera (strain JEL478) TaxID=1344416 RepID=A0A139A9A2_GONPJ|nr:kinase-like protein [Gonapodya prolifera JEL478]|eukprot:KXS13327.1 kinase-like protein [Gonapodya prolifera JEL478]
MNENGDASGGTSASSASKGRTSTTGNALSEGNLAPISIQEYTEYDEILKLRNAALKKEEGDLLAQQERLSVERDHHVRELRRIRDEDASRFNKHPMLNGRYLLLELLGRGGFSEVWKGFDSEDMRIVAVKIHSLNSQWSDERKKTYTRHAMREYAIHQRLLHNRIVRLFDVFEIDDQSFATVLEYCDGTDLESHLHSVKMLPEREARSIVTQVFSGLRYLNEISPPVIHYDLKPGNILFHNGEVRITDFGLSKVVEPDVDDGAKQVMGPPRPVAKWAKEIELTSQGAGTIWYLPPECFESSKTGDAPRISSKVDVWSMGVIFYELLYGVKPFGRDQSQQTILRNDSITNEAHLLTFPAKPTVGQETKDFIRKCLEYRKERRPDVLTLCNDSYLNPAAKNASGTASAGSGNAGSSSRSGSGAALSSVMNGLLDQ